MTDVRRLKICGVSYKIKPLNHSQKHILTRHRLAPIEWLYVSETDSYLRIVKKESLGTNSVIVKTISKYGKE